MVYRLRSADLAQLYRSGSAGGLILLCGGGEEGREEAFPPGCFLRGSGNTATVNKAVKFDSGTAPLPSPPIAITP